MSKNMLRTGTKVFRVIHVLIVIILMLAALLAFAVTVNKLYSSQGFFFSLNFGHHFGYQKFVGTANVGQAYNYQPLAPIPGVTDSLTGADAGNLKSYINNIFKLGIGLCSALAVIMIIYGGFMYVLNSGNEGKVTEARKTIVNAVYGLVLALCIVIILNAVNKDLVAGKLFDDLRVETPEIDVTILRITPDQQSYPYAQISQYYGNNYNVDPTQPTSQTNPNLNYYGNPYANTSSANANYTGSNPRLDTDGTGAASWDSTHQGETAYQNGRINAFTDPYVVVNDRSQLGQKFLVTDYTTGLSVVAVGADVGHGFGEISPAAAQAVGMWRPGQGNSLPNHSISIQPYTGNGG